MRRASLFSILLSVAGIHAATQPESNSVLIRNVTVHPVTAPAISNGSVLIVNGKIAEVGTRVGARGSAKVVDGHGLHLYPGMINAATNVGLQEISSLRDSVDLDEIGLFNPQLRAEIAFNPSSEHIPVVRAGGITTVLSLPSAGASLGRRGQSGIITGQASLMHLDGWTWEDMAVMPSAAVDTLFPQIQTVPARYAAFLSTPPQTFKDLDREYKESLRQMSDFLEGARRYQKAKAARLPDFRPDEKLEAMIPVIEGKRPMFVRASKERAIKDAVAFADKEKVKIIIANPEEIGSTGPLLKSHNIPVVLGKVLALPDKDDDAYDQPYTLPNDFYKAGVKICFGTFDVEFARNVPFEAATAAAFGLPQEEALKGLTINTAQIFGVADQIGSIEKGRSGDLILTDGDPLEAKTNIKQMFIAGKEVSLESRHTREYEKWSKRP